MAPTRKSRSVNKRFSNSTEVSPDKDVGNSYKSRQRKRKLSDMLGSQWSKDELQLFYEAFRNYGKDWKKVAGVLRNRSVEMVEALYNMNRAYLSLPEGTASVAGLIAMMTDHYNVLEGSASDGESNDASRVSRNPQKRGRGKVQLSALKDRLQSQSVASNDGCLSLLKRRCSDGCTVGKRTPRFPVSYSFRKDDGENYVSPNKRGWKSEVDDEVTHGAVLALTEGLQRGGSPQVSHSPFKTERMKYTPLHSRERMRSQSEIASPKLPGTATDEDYLEYSLGSRGAENGDYVRDITSALMGIEGVGTVEVSQKGKKFYRKKGKVENIRINQFDDGREACSGTEEGPAVSDVKGTVDIEVTNVKIEGTYSQGKRKRNKKLFFGDESSALDALQTLADLSLMMPASTIESESSAQLNEQKPNLDLADRSSVPEAMSISHQGDKTKILRVREKVPHASSGVEASTSGKCKLGRDCAVDVDALSQGEQYTQSSNKAWKRKQKSSLLKAFAEVEEKPVIKGKRTGQIFAPSKQWKLIRPAECSSSNSDQKRAGTDTAASTAQVPTTSQVNLPTKQRSRRKMDPKRMLIQKEMRSGVIISKDRPDKYCTSLQDKLSCYLSPYLVRRWCTFEWFYSAIDYPWFAKREFVEYLNHVGLGHIPRLTRVEWGVIRSSLGKPRRFSEHFLGEEKEKLKQYRESVRKHYTELRAGIRDGLPTDLARPLSVGQRVIALHPKSREIHDGSVLTVDHEKCRIQFDRPEFGVEFVMDIDCMPLNPLENMPEALRGQNIAVDKVSVNSREQKAGQLNSGGSMVFAPCEHLENVCGPIHTSKTQTKDDTACAVSRAKAAAIDIVNMQQAAYRHHYTVAHVNAREADIWAVSDLTRSLDKKEAILMELKHAKDDVLKTQNGGDDSVKDSEFLKKQYTMVSSAPLSLRQHNTYLGNSPSPCLKPAAISTGLGGPPSSVEHSLVNYQESGSNVVEIVKDSRFKAHTMVDAAIQALSSMKEGEDAFMRIGEALDSKFSPDSGLLIRRSPEQVNGVACQHQLSSSTLEPPLIGHVSGPKLHNDSDRIEAQIPSDLITSCVATLLMVQMCTERQYPPADVAQILDSAVTSLHPCCPQNLPIYRDIQMCMGRIKTQILALVPT
ncbi:hypothetical protein F0562_029347 [Nyssa sinensis]|uniref:SANT domain-containing protein n=1 Tax=Nyssa sinensis TaxID=561372 RepID=A0A5J5B2G8_9ASTE|nr:hypothetical protein F0562_029347 [Nyssa sinensis]